MNLLGLAYEQPDDYGTQRDRHINGRNRGGLLCVRVDLGIDTANQQNTNLTNSVTPDNYI